MKTRVGGSSNHAVLTTSRVGRWEALARRGARAQRPLWASTGVKNKAYPDTLYVDDLIGPNTVNTMPDATLLAFADHGKVRYILQLPYSTVRSTV